MSDQPRIRVFCVDDHPLLREGIATLINNQPDMVVVGQASTVGRPSKAFGSIVPTSLSWISDFPT